MSRIVEGTTLAGYECDCVGCWLRAVFSPVVCVPYEGFPVSVRNPIIGFVDVHVCPDHWPALRIDEMMTKPMRDSIEAIAVEHNGRPAFKRAYLKKILCHSSEYLQFQQRAGLVAPDDALAKLAMH